jgi:hypothetical protein
MKRYNCGAALAKDEVEADFVAGIPIRALDMLSVTAIQNEYP